MIFDLDFVLYASVSRGTTVLAEFINSSGDGDLETLASQCLEKYPQLHLKFSHTIRKRIYSFLIDDPFVYFAIIDECLGKSTSFQLLECLREAFTRILSSNSKSVEEFENLSCYCFQEELEPIFSSLIVRSCNVRSLQSLEEMFSSDDHEKKGVLIDSRCSGKKDLSGQLVSKKKKRKSVEEMMVPMMKSEGNTRETPIENRVDVSDDDEGSREFSVSLQKINGSSMGLNARDGKKMWRRHVWTVVLLDLVVCFALFGVWLWVCKGFECLAN